jgi:2-oxoglutarate dehydrogenase E2 component (dihydrolipoamide succinyltransferase)
MAVELKVPHGGESITEVQIGQWLKRPGEPLRRDQPVVTIETDKATLEICAPVSGTITQVLKQAGETAKGGEVIGYMEESAVASVAAAPPVPRPANEQQAATLEQAPALVFPSRDREGAVVPLADARGSVAPEPAAPAAPGERRVRMSPIRRRIAARLVEAQHAAALLTTFNEADLSAVAMLRQKHREAFQERHKAKLGIMSFFVKAAVEALKTVPQVNAEIQGDEIVYHDRYDIGIAVGGGRGLVVPVLRNADRMSFAQIELAIADFSQRASENRIGLEELQGGTFTISNGGVFGSLLSTPIVNPPQSGILGLHAIQDRPVVRDGQIVIRPMMYLALTYDHRLVDGREAITFLKRVKECVEEPPRLVLDV